MDTFHLYQDIQARTKGEIYIGVVGPVRTGKSTFVRRFMEQLVLPHMKKENSQVSKDELPVSGGGKTITTVEPKFVPAKAAEVELDEGITAKIRLIDCVGFVIDGAFGLDENNQVRMVKTPWLKEAIPFPQALPEHISRRVTDAETDGNGHLNNCLYLRWGQDLLPEEFLRTHALRSVWIDYRKEMPRGMESELTYSLDNSTLYVRGTADEKERFLLRMEYNETV